MLQFSAATEPTMHFIGVTTTKSAIMSIFPHWARVLGLNGVLHGIDFVPNADPTRYREAVAFLKSDPLSLGALVTTHKVNLLRATRDLFEVLDPHAMALHEVSSISKRDGRLIGHAMDPITVGEALLALVPQGHWASHPGHVLILGAGGSSLALSLHLHQRALTGDGPNKMTITGISTESLDEMRRIHAEIGLSIPTDYVLTRATTETDALITALMPGALVVNATGLGKDAPGAPTGPTVRFPEGTTVWEFNYRGDLEFLRHARAQERAQGLKVADGWAYFLISWTRVIGQVFDVDIPTSGPKFDQLEQIARAQRV